MRVITLLFLHIAACDAGTVQIDIKGTPLTVEIADDAAERAKGLMYRDSMPADHGMLFAYPKDEPRRFWMKNTRIPLSVAFLAADGTVLCLADMQPLTEERTPCEKPVRYAIEVNQGWFAARGLTEGDRISGIPEISAR